MFAGTTVLVKPVCLQEDTKAALHSDSLGVWGNVSALITHLFWEGGRKKKKDQLKWNLRRSPQLPGLSDCCGCKFLSNSSRFAFFLTFLKHFSERCWPACPAASQLKKAQWLVWPTDRMVTVTVAEQSHEGEAWDRERERRGEGGSHDSTDCSVVAKWWAGLKHPYYLKMLRLTHTLS